ncbi:hypothetical protein GC163_19575 [bacterium]|nr:hypothetical protein [bacterium]
MQRRGWLAAIWVWGFLAVFICQPLPNAGIPHRYDILPLLPFAVMDAIDPPVELSSPPRGLEYLPERLPLFGIAAVIGLAAWSAGRWFLQLAPTLNLSTAERNYFAVLIGLGLVSLLTLGLGLLGWLSPVVFWGCHLALIISAALRYRVATNTHGTSSVTHPITRQDLWWLPIALPFLIGMCLGSLSPSTDFDVNEYHLGGPKEWYLAGQIGFLEHDIYTSFPFLTEMLLLDGMVLYGDWYWGALAGQAAVMLFTPVTACGIWLCGRRWFSNTAGAIAAIVYLSTPWVFRMSIIPLAEGGLASYVFGSTFAALLAFEQFRRWTMAESRTLMQPVWLTGVCAGGAMACKYTGLVLAVGPWMALLSLVAAIRAKRVWLAAAPEQRPPRYVPRMRLQTVAVLLLGVCVLIGPWLLKNLVETGNPVYPLGYSVFGGRDLDDELAAKWKHGHARPNAGSVFGEARDLVMKAFDVAAVNDWQSPLIFALAPLALLIPRSSPNFWRVILLSAVTFWMFLAWWLFTHHLDRFWIPLIPTGALLAGIGVAQFPHQPLRGIIGGGLTVGLLFNLGFVSTGLVGYNAGLTKLSAASELATRTSGPEIAWLNAAIQEGELPPDTKVLCVGDAELFHARFPYVYNTVFDRSIFEEWCGVPDFTTHGDRALKSAADIRKILREHGITHVYVSWSEILRYRQPYSYGYSDFVHPLRFDELVADGVLGRPLTLPAGMGRQLITEPENDTAKLARAWAPELIIRSGSDSVLITGQIYPVLSD